MNQVSIEEVLSKEKPKFHMTYEGNVNSIRRLGLIPHNGERNGKLISKEDPENRVFFSNGKEATLQLANIVGENLDRIISKSGKFPDGYDGADLYNKMESFFEQKNNNNSDMTFGLIDICNYVTKLFDKGIKEDLSKDEYRQNFIYNI